MCIRDRLKWDEIYFYLSLYILLKTKIEREKK
jgi:hypothetical protein